MLRVSRLAAFVLGIVAFGQDVPAFLTPGEDSVRRDIREARNRRFNLRLPFSMLEPGPDGMHPVSIVDLEPLPEMPYAVSDVVVIGELIWRRPFVSADGKGLYTEETIRVSEVVKAPEGAALSPRDRIVILREGGAGKMADQRVVRHEIRGYVIPELKQHYLFFLRQERALDAFFARKFWRIADGALQPCFPRDFALKSNSQFAGKPVGDVVAHLKSGAQRN